MGHGRPVRGLTAQQAQTQELDTNIYIYTTRIQHVDSEWRRTFKTFSQLVMCCEKKKSGRARRDQGGEGNKSVKSRYIIIITCVSLLID